MATHRTPAQPVQSESCYRNKRRWNKDPVQSSSVPPVPIPKAPVITPPAVRKSILQKLPVPVPAKPVPTIEGILAGQLSPETQRAYRSDLKHFLSFLEFEPMVGNNNDAEILRTLGEVTRAKATEYRDYMLQVKGFAAATVVRRMSTIANLYEILREEGIISKSPFRRVKRPKVSSEGTTAVFSKEQAERLISTPDTSTPMGRRNRVILLLLLWTGIRRSSLCAIEGADFVESNQNHLLRIKGKGKSDKSDTVLVPPRIWGEVKAWIDEVGDGPLFTGASRNGAYNRKEKSISPTRVYLLFKKYCKMAGLDPDAFSPHTTRATFITLALQGGASIQSVAYAVNHADISTTARYDRARRNLDNHASRFLPLEPDAPSSTTPPSSSSTSS